MQGLITCVLILGFVSPCLCLGSNVGTTNIIHNVVEFGARGDGRFDDSQAFLRAWSSTCGAEGTATLVIPPGRSFLVTNLEFLGPCKATSVYILLQGKIVAPSMVAWRDKSYWIRIMNVNRLSIYGGGIIDGYGSTWWQCRCPRPIALFFHGCNGLTVSHLSITNSPGAHIGINGCFSATFSFMNILAPRQSPNTDGFDISASKNILIEDSTISTGDDCIAINGGSSFINATRVTCGPGHGISVGSLGRDGAHEIVEEVYVQHCTFKWTENGARIKTWPGGSGYARKITFDQIFLIDVSNPIIIDQKYNLINTTSAVQVSDVTYRGFNGTSVSDEAIDLDCSSLGCFNIVLDQIHIVSAQPGRKTYASCRNAHGRVGSNVVPTVSCMSRY